MLTWSFTAVDARDAADARTRFRSALDRWGPIGNAADLELVFGELVGNVVRHAPGRVDVRAVRSDDAVTLTVSDDGPGFNGAFLESSDPLAESGRGFTIVRGLCRSVSIAVAPGGGTIISVVVPCGSQPGGSTLSSSVPTSTR